MHEAKNLIGETRLINFFRVAKAMQLHAAYIYPADVCDMLDDGRCLEDIFNPDIPQGKLTIMAKLKDNGVFRIELGFYMGPLAADGVYWNVAFDGDEVQAISVEGIYRS